MRESGGGGGVGGELRASRLLVSEKISQYSRFGTAAGAAYHIQKAAVDAAFVLDCPSLASNAACNGI